MRIALVRVAESLSRHCLLFPASPLRMPSRTAGGRYPALLEKILADWPRPSITAGIPFCFQPAGNRGELLAPSVVRHIQRALTAGRYSDCC